MNSKEQVQHLMASNSRLRFKHRRQRRTSFERDNGAASRWGELGVAAVHAARLNPALQHLVQDGDLPGVCGKRNPRKMSLSCLASSILTLEKGRRRASQLRDQELLQAAENGDVQILNRIFDNENEVNVNCTDMLGRSPLQLAVTYEHQDVVNYLLDKVDLKSTYEALLLAIKLGHDEVAEMILEHPKYEEVIKEFREHEGETFFAEKFSDNSQFTEEVTPMILAGQHNRYEIVMALLMKDQGIEKPHKHNCLCSLCHEKARKDELKFAKSRLNAYKGMASEAYISLSSQDPILASFELRHELNAVARAEKYYTAEYTELASSLSDYVVKLLDKVQGNEELNVLLNNSVGLDHTENKTLARLQLALEYKEKKFVAHPSCQKKLTTMWYASCEWLKNRSWPLSMVFFVAIAIGYPFMATIYMISPRSKLGEFIRTPVVKFIAETCSFLLFLFMIVGNSFLERSRLCDKTLASDVDISSIWSHLGSNITRMYDGFDTQCVRNHHPDPLQLTITAWICALIWTEMKQVYHDGASVHFSSVYNHMDFFMLGCYTASLSLRFTVYFKTYWSVQFFHEYSSWIRLLKKDYHAQYMMYWLIPDRFYWDTLDPIHISEALYSVANVLTFSRLFYLLAINEHLGPMLISLERMIKDVMKFMVTFLLILFAFMVGLHNMYWYYEPSTRGLVEIKDHNITTKAELGFGTLEMTFRTVHWALFGLSDPKVVEIGYGYRSRIIDSVGYIVFGVYHWAVVIILFNMLIAMMTRSFEKITRDQDVEWKYSRSQLYMEYIKTGSTLPVPFNIIPSPKSISRTLRYLASRLKKFFCINRSDCLHRKSTASILRQHSSRTSGNSESGDDETMFVSMTEKFDCKSQSSGELTYQTVIKRVVRRYIFEQLQESITTDGEFDSIKQAIQALQDDVKRRQKEDEYASLQQRNMLDSLNSLHKAVFPNSNPMEQHDNLLKKDASLHSSNSMPSFRNMSPQSPLSGSPTHGVSRNSPKKTFPTTTLRSPVEAGRTIPSVHETLTEVDEDDDDDDDVVENGGTVVSDKCLTPETPGLTELDVLPPSTSSSYENIALKGSADGLANHTADSSSEQHSYITENTRLRNHNTNQRATADEQKLHDIIEYTSNLVRDKPK